ncbi:MAG: HipA N-terminal domain-containing protein [Treponemataceae bacterium]
MRKARVWCKDVLAGYLEETEDGYQFTYVSDYPARPDAHGVSLTMPLRQDPYRSKTLFPFFDGLIPEGWLLELGTKNWKLDPKDRFALLSAFCRDSIGAVGVDAAENEHDA